MTATNSPTMYTVLSLAQVRDLYNHTREKALTGPRKLRKIMTVVLSGPLVQIVGDPCGQLQLQSHAVTVDFRKTL